MESDKKLNKTLGEKIKAGRLMAGYTQEKLAEQIGVSRQAVTKWESDKGMPDIDNIKLISKLLNISIDYLLDDGGELDMSVVREKISLDDYEYKASFSGRWVKKTGKKDMIVREKFPSAEIYMLFFEQLNTKSEKVIDNLLGFFTDAPFGIPQLINGLKNTDKEFYLVNEAEKQYLVVVTDEFIEIRQLPQRINDKKFEIGQYRFIKCGVL